MKHTIVIVTYNRLTLLKECLEAAMSQVVPYNEIIIVNNASTDGTEDYLKGVSSEKRLFVINRKKNIGGAGGFTQGICTAFKRKADWITIIDDDAILRPDFHEEICKAIDYFRGEVQCFAGIPLTNGIRPNHRRRVMGKWVRYEKPVPEAEYDKRYFDCDIVSFCGLVVNRSVIARIGFPEKRFFIWYDDTEYSLRISKICRIVNWNKAVIDHKADVPNSASHVPSWKEYYGIRNNIYTACKHYGCMSAAYLAARKSAKGIVTAVRCARDGETKKAFWVIRLYEDAIRDGLAHRLGIHRKYYPI